MQRACLPQDQRKMDSTTLILIIVISVVVVVLLFGLFLYVSAVRRLKSAFAEKDAEKGNGRRRKSHNHPV